MCCPSWGSQRPFYGEEKRSQLLLHILETFRFIFKDEYDYGRDPFNQNFGPKLNGSVRSNRKSFEKVSVGPVGILVEWIAPYKNEIFSILSSAGVQTNVILARKLDRRRHSTTSFSENVVVAETS